MMQEIAASLYSWFKTQPLIVEVLCCVVPLAFIGFVLSAFIWMRKDPHRPYKDPGGVRGFLLDVSMWCLVIAETWLVAGLSLCLIGALVWLFIKLEFPDVIAFGLGLFLGVLVLSKIFRAFGIR